MLDIILDPPESNPVLMKERKEECIAVRGILCTQKQPGVLVLLISLDTFCQIVCAETPTW